MPGATRAALADRDQRSLVEVAVTRDPGRMLPVVDARTLQRRAGDRPL